jgi:hypothetical protein
MMVEFLKQEQERDAVRQPLTIGEMKAREAATPAPRRAPAEPVRETRSAAQAEAPVPPSRALAPAAPASPADKPAPEIVTNESGPLVAPEAPMAPDATRPGGFAPLTSWALGWADRAVDATGLRQIPSIVRTIKGGNDTVEFQAMSDARLVGASR